MNISNREQFTGYCTGIQPNHRPRGSTSTTTVTDTVQAQSAALAGQAVESQARARKLDAETRAIPVELETDQINAATKNLAVGDADDKEFERRMEVTDRLLREKQLNLQQASQTPPAPQPEARPN